MVPASTLTMTSPRCSTASMWSTSTSCSSARSTLVFDVRGRRLAAPRLHRCPAALWLQKRVLTNSGFYFEKMIVSKHIYESLD
eukprot:4389088-Prymnesium_polylepis.1